MRCFLMLMVLLVAWPVRAQTFVQVQNAFNSALGTSLTATPASAVGSGNFVVAWVRHGTDNTSSISVSDNLSQTWTQVGSNCNSTTNDLGAMWYKENSGAITSVTVTYGASVNNRSLLVLEFSGVATSSSLDANAGCSSNPGGPTSLTSASLTTTNANDLLIYAVNVGATQSGGSAWTQGTSYTIPSNTNTDNAASGSNERAAIQYQVVTTTQSAVTTVITYTTGANVHGLFAAFKKAGSVAAPQKPPVVL
jgi:hypothetical protein